MAATSPALRVDGLDVLRALAALSVFFYHLCTIFEIRPTYALLEQASLPIRFGWMGVHLFYVLSGFFITLAVIAPARFDPLRFMRRRILRIVPVYYVSILLVVVLTRPYFISNAHGLYHLGMNLSFFHHLDFETMGSINGSYWTLGVEWFFYLLMAVAGRWLRGPGFWRCLILATLIAWTWRAGVLLTPGLSDLNRFYYTSLLPGALDEFAAGAAVAWLYVNRPDLRDRLAAHGWAFALAGLLLYGLGMGIIAQAGSMVWSRWSSAVIVYVVLAAGFAALLQSFILLEPGKAIHRFARYSGLGYLGKISFSIYIWHLPVLKALSIERHQYSSLLALMATACVATLLLSAVSYHLIEERFHPSRETKGTSA